MYICVRVFVYAARIGKILLIPFITLAKSLSCRLIVSPKVVEKKRPRFFKQGRCIAAVAETRSFIAHARGRDELWGHPALCGYVFLFAPLFHLFCVT